ncbi:ATP-binding protein [Methylogaea oryzae]|uniref:histidine kinase n=1 Tax=Methylogaea oryzae TaxID=1295382 RepID=A0A8D5AMN0_9GAMM|nr:ATP-binding protein [Methylogaea oryzae]BBL71250.1 sensor histidine kinase [Methylogaea oryzae]
MDNLIEADSDATCREHLYWLFRLRNLMIGGIGLLLILSVYGLDIPLRQAPLLGTLCVFGVFNWLTLLRLHSDTPVQVFELFLQIAGDIFGISILLYFTGGATNPIAWFFLLPLIIAATVLPQTYTWYLVIFASSCYTVLIGYHVPLPNIQPAIAPEMMPGKVQALMEHNHLELHAFGMWFGFVFSAGLVAYFVVEMANTLRERDRKLAEAREQSLRNDRVISLGTLAAGAAHEMGTPLGTMAILLKEMEHFHNGENDADLRDKLKILRDQVDRCKEALSVMSASAGQLRAESGRKMRLDNYLADVISQWRSLRPEAPLEFDAEGAKPTPCIIAERTLTHTLINILNNAAEVSPKYVGFRARWTGNRITLDISDHGPGIREDLFAVLGKRPITTKEQGLGVGLFLAHTTIERLGGKIEILPNVEIGACIRIQLPLLPTDSCDN